MFPLYAALSGIAQVAVPVYAFLALRRLYGGSIVATIGKEIGIIALYAMAYGVAMMCLMYYAAVAS